MLIAIRLGPGAGVLALCLTWAILRGWTDTLDHRLFLAIRPRSLVDEKGKRIRLAAAAADLSTLGGDTFRILFIVACLSLLGAAGRWREAWIVVITIIGARLLLFLVKHAVKRPRPDPAGHGVDTYTTSFPSGHTFMAMVSLLSLALVSTSSEPFALRATAVALSVSIGSLVAYARIFLGVHWPSDVIAAWMAGVAWAVTTAMLAGAL